MTAATLDDRAIAAIAEATRLARSTGEQAADMIWSDLTFTRTRDVELGLELEIALVEDRITKAFVKQFRPLADIVDILVETALKAMAARLEELRGHARDRSACR